MDRRGDAPDQRDEAEHGGKSGQDAGAGANPPSHGTVVATTGRQEAVTEGGGRQRKDRMYVAGGRLSGWAGP
ncbi:MAG: hypothetical protein ACPIOQ_34255 [Promethearchaeia archaeon]